MLTKTKYRTKKKSRKQKTVSEYCASFEINIIFDQMWSVKTLENCERLQRLQWNGYNGKS